MKRTKLIFSLILKTSTNIYTKKIQIKNCENFTFFYNETKTLEQNNDNAQSSHLSEYECGIAMKEMQINKSPGSDGLTADFFKIFWNDIKQFLINSLNYSFDN